MQQSALSFRLLFGVAVAAAPVTLVAQQGIFTAAQAQSGRAIYTQNCAGCHGADFEGSGDAPALAGGTFMLKWRTKMVSELFGEILQNMPPTNPGSLGEPASLSATAYILQRNGAQIGQQSLAPGATTLVGAVATGQAVPAQGAGRGGRGGRGGTTSLILGAGSTAGSAGRGQLVTTRGVTVQGEVSNYVPVTAAMLKNPPAEDWLIFGRNYQRHSFSPLNQITRDNVKNLQLKWTW